MGQGRSSPNTNSVFDNLVKAYDENQQAVFGRLATDRPHQFKIQGSYAFDFGTTVGLSTWIASGTPLSRTISVHSTIFYWGRMSDGRTPTYSNFDLHFDQKTPTTYHMSEATNRVQKVAWIIGTVNVRTEGA